MTVFLDATVLVAGLTTRGICADLFRLLLTEHRLATSKAVLRRVRDVLVDELRIPASTADQVIPFLREHAAVIGVGDGDNMLAIAAADVDALITTERRLLEARPGTAVIVTTPRGFWEHIRSSSAGTR